MERKTVRRERYLEILRRNRDDCGFVKIVTGVRRSGKTFLLDMFRSEVSESVRDPGTVLYYRMESLDMEDYLDSSSMSRLVIPKLPVEGRSYLFVDEIQEIEGWQRFVDAVMVDRPGCDIYITGSNAFLLSGEMATYLTGRYVEIPILPFSFDEFCEARSPVTDYPGTFMEFLTHGSMPFIPPFCNEEDYRLRISSLLDTIVTRDILYRSDRSISGDKLRRILAFVVESTGKMLSISRIAKKLRLADKTVEDYIGLFEQCFLVYRAESYSLSGSAYLTTPSKYYVVDTGLRAAAMNFRIADYGQILETAVFFELRRRGYAVSVGKGPDYEIDFVAEKDGRTEYYQVCWSLSDRDTAEREVSALMKVKDYNPRTIITGDPYAADLDNGIRCVNAQRWMRGERRSRPGGPAAVGLPEGGGIRAIPVLLAHGGGAVASWTSP